MQLARCNVELFDVVVVVVAIRVLFPHAPAWKRRYSAAGGIGKEAKRNSILSLRHHDVTYVFLLRERAQNMFSSAELRFQI